MGGNVFGTTDKINREDIEPTLKNFLKEFMRLFPAAEPHFRKMQTLGSAGKKKVSGDIDLALSATSFDKISDWGLDPEYVYEQFELFKGRARTSTDDQLMKRAVIVAIAKKIEDANSYLAVDVKGSAAGALFLQAPQFNEAGEELDKNVQIDINVGDIDWLKFAYYSNVSDKDDDASDKEVNASFAQIKGLHRTQLLIALFAYKKHTFSHNYGVKDSATQKIVATNPTQAINLLNSLYKVNFTAEILQNYDTIMATLRAYLSEVDLKEVYNSYLKKLDSTKADIPSDLQDYWIKNQELLNLKGKFLPNKEVNPDDEYTSALIKYQKK